MNEADLSQTVPEWMKEHVRLYFKDPDAGHTWHPPTNDSGSEITFDTLLMTTLGRKSGKQLLLPLIYQPTGDGNYCIIASKGGAPSHPAWFLNLQAEEKVEVKVAHEEFNAKARVAEGEERARLWKIMSEHYASYNDYQAATDREIPVVVLERVE
ncbi:MAG: deazaflavin-dependent oxidoreductase (nitroreductase family) [Candidatus Azotimanducaceae bacterium]|jgi:deazaflavin-dependent oxidoreductase (nitroreductase family)